MTKDDKRLLTILLHRYMDELLQDVKKGYKTGMKAQYAHARCISRKLTAEINREIEPY